MSLVAFAFISSSIELWIELNLGLWKSWVLVFFFLWCGWS